MHTQGPVTFEVNKEGYFGNFGGQHVPEILHPVLQSLASVYRNIIESPDFRRDYHYLLNHYVGRPSPLWLSPSLSSDCGCKVYLKREDLNHTGAHKINNAIGQALLAKRLGKRRIIAETGAGQHGVATATVCALSDLKCTIYMGQTDIERQSSNVQKMQLLGAEVRQAGGRHGTLKEACNAAIEDWRQHPEDTYYMVGSAVGPHPYPDMVARLQSVISEELQEQLLEAEGRACPDRLVACIGGGSNAGGTIFHYLNEPDVEIVLAEAGGIGTAPGRHAATLSRGKEGILHGARTLIVQDEAGQVADTHSISAGLDYPGIGPLYAHLVQTGRAKVLAITDDEALEAALRLNRREGILPALESAHALAALRHLTFRPAEVVVVTLSGRGDKDLPTYLQQTQTP